MDRFKNPVRVDWPRHHLVWIDAALTLRGDEHKEALNDIAAMTCRSYAAVYCKASRRREEARVAARMCRRMERFVSGAPPQDPGAGNLAHTDARDRAPVGLSFSRIRPSVSSRPKGASEESPSRKSLTGGQIHGCADVR